MLANLSSPSIAKSLLIAGTALAALCSAPLYAQTGQAAEVDQVDASLDPSIDDDEAIVVTGQRPPGSVIGDIPPENILGPRDVRAYGAASLGELLDALAPQTRSGRGRNGGAPVTLLNGRRISGFREIREIPPEAVARVEILPEEVALKYGYRADQRVVNIVLRPRFRSVGVRTEGALATGGGRETFGIDGNLLRIGENGRTTFDFSYDKAGLLTEDERDIARDLVGVDLHAIDQRSYRSLIGSSEGGHLGATVSRTLFGDVAASFSVRAERNEGRSLLGVPTALLSVPPTNPFAAQVGSGEIVRAFEANGPLVRDTRSKLLRLAAGLNGDKQRWRWSLTASHERAASRNLTDRGLDTAAVQARIDANDSTLDPLGAIDRLVEALGPRDRGRSFNRRSAIDLTASKQPLRLPAGPVSITLGANAGRIDQDSNVRRAGVVDRSSLGRSSAAASASLDVPIAKRDGAWGAIGGLTANFNAQLSRLSDFGTLWVVGGGVNWSLAKRMTILASVTREEGAPSIGDLGDPVLATPGTRLFDLATGQSVLATVVTGGNSALDADSRMVWKLGGSWQPSAKLDLDLRADFTRSRLTDPVGALQAPTAAIEAAFPDRFVRDASGRLLFADLRPVNFQSAERDELRWGFNLSKPLKSQRPSQSLVDQWRRSRGDGADGAAPHPGGGSDGARRSGGGSGRGGFGGRGYGGGRGGRLQMSVYHTLHLADRIAIGRGVPALDYLDGELRDSNGGRPRHELEAEGGWFNNGLGARLAANWRSGTEVRGGTDSSLDFSPLARANLRLFANLGERFDLVAQHPWLRGMQVRLNVDNLFDARQKVRGASGAVPASYQPDLIDPVGRSVSISLRKLFLPSPGRWRRDGGRSAPTATPPLTAEPSAPDRR